MTQTSHFTWTATTANISGTTTEINNFATNGLPGAILFVTPNWDQGGVCPCTYDSSAIGVYYDPSTGKWTIFNEDNTAMTAGEEFNVLVVPSTSSTVFVQTATSSNSTGDSTSISNPQTDGKPSALLMATQVWSGSFNNHTQGVWYTGSQWAIFNEDGTTMNPGATYNVMVGPSQSNGGKEVLQKATTANRMGVPDSTFLNSAASNGNPNAVLFATPNWNPGGVCPCTYNTSPVGVWWDYATPQRAAVFNEDTSTMANHSAFNVLLFSS